MIQRESGGDPAAVNGSSGAGGLYGFLPSTWASLGYSGLPQNASAATQREAFQKAYAQSGSGPWSASPPVPPVQNQRVVERGAAEPRNLQCLLVTGDGPL